ncbi:MAG TPA: hypothetical protein VFY36_03630 [Solirubrobacteraceae bacterium]|nr:hypothetical protein [Solirubrobacteraceae bacterium]
MPDAIQAHTTYWMWADPSQLNMPAILEVRVWESGEHRVETPLNIYVHWECADGSLTEIERSIIAPEEFMQLKAAGALVSIGSLPAEVDEPSSSAQSKPPTAE